MEAQYQIQFRKFDFAKKLDLDIDIIAHAETYLKESVSKQEESIQWMFESYLDVMDGLIEAAENHNACCSGAVAATVAAAKVFGAKNGKKVAYSTSYDLSPGDSFVGYSGIVY